MALERTLTILKPDCVRKGLIGEVTKRIQEAGFKILALKMVSMQYTKRDHFMVNFVNS
jgi:nucleoside-diphosphate kinase